MELKKLVLLVLLYSTKWSMSYPRQQDSNNWSLNFFPSHAKMESRRLPLLTRTALPSLVKSKVRGFTESLEDFMARIDTPQLDHLNILISSCLDQDIVLRHSTTPSVYRSLTKATASCPRIYKLWHWQIRDWIYILKFCSYSRWKSSPLIRDSSLPVWPGSFVRPFPPSTVGSPHRSNFATRSAKPHEECPMAGTSATIC